MSSKKSSSKPPVSKSARGATSLKEDARKKRVADEEEVRSDEMNDSSVQSMRQEDQQVEPSSTPVSHQKSATEEPALPWYQRLRGSKKFRLAVIALLMIIVGVLFFFYEKFRIWLGIVFVLLATAFGMEVANTDFDLQQLIKTRSFEESKVERTVDGDILFDKAGNIVTDATKGKKADDYNCSDFASQPESQTFFDRVGGAGNDINRLDGDKDGEPCESLPRE
jgi:hypothetical protein